MRMRLVLGVPRGRPLISRAIPPASRTVSPASRAISLSLRALPPILQTPPLSHSRRRRREPSKPP